MFAPLISHATTTEWNGSASDHDWFNAANWDMGVPGLLDTAIVGADSVNITGVVDIKYLEVIDLARLVISPNGKLRILNSDGAALLCSKSIIYNYGLIRIFDPVLKGLVLSGDSKLFNFMGADVFIESAGSNSVHVNLDGELLNFPGANIQIDDCVHSLFNEGVVLNRGELGIYITESNGIFNEGELTNEGVIRIDSTGSTGLENHIGGIINNADSLIITRVSDSLSGISPLLNWDSITNSLNGVLLIQGSNNDNGIRNKFNSSMVNDGTITVKDQITGLTCEPNSEFRNNGLLDMVITKDGMNISSSFINEESGRIEIATIDGVNAFGTSINVFNGGVLTNYGNILLEGAFNRAFYNIGGIVNNYDSLNINESTASWPFANQDTFYNYQGGVLFINNTKISSFGNCVDNSIDGNIINEGEVKIIADDINCLINNGSVVNNGLMTFTSPRSGIVNNGPEFINNSNGHIIVQNPEHSIKNDSIMTNYGTITIDNAEEIGFENTGTFTNEGKMSVTNVIVLGIQNSGILINSDTIELDEIKFMGILNTDSLYLDTNSFISIKSVSSPADPMLIQNEKSIINHGQITLDAISLFANDGVGLFCLPNSYWLNSNSSELTLLNFEAIIDWILIEFGAEFISSGIITME